MVFCPICGKKIPSGMEKCPSCGATKIEMLRVLEEGLDNGKGVGVKEKSRSGERCIECGNEAEGRCFFCGAPICKKHSYSMRIFSMNVPIGREVNACFICAKKEDGRTPTKREAQEVGVYFNIKPYYEWRRV